MKGWSGGLSSEKFSSAHPPHKVHFFILKSLRLTGTRVSGMLLLALLGSASAQNYCTATDGSGNTLDFGPVRDGGTFTGVDSSGNQIAFVRRLSFPSSRELWPYPPTHFRSPTTLLLRAHASWFECRTCARSALAPIAPLRASSVRFAVLGACAPPFSLCIARRAHSHPHSPACRCSARDAVRWLRLCHCF